MLYKNQAVFNGLICFFPDNYASPQPRSASSQLIAMSGKGHPQQPSTIPPRVPIVANPPPTAAPQSISSSNYLLQQQQLQQQVQLPLQPPTQLAPQPQPNSNPQASKCDHCSKVNNERHRACSQRNESRSESRFGT